MLSLVTSGFVLFNLVNVHSVTVINGTWVDDFIWDVSLGINGWSDSNIDSGLTTYHGDYTNSNSGPLERDFQCGYNANVDIKFIISFDCDCDVNDNVLFKIDGNIEDTVNVDTYSVTLYNDQGGNSCGGKWYKTNLLSYNILTIPQFTTFRIRYEFDLAGGGPQVVIWNISINCIVITSSPTNNPSNNPTNVPSNNPTQLPSTHPSNVPSVNPSKIPSTNPSQIPSTNPTKIPSKYPTISPTEIPTDSPNMNPIKSPTITPTELPTATPISESGLETTSYIYSTMDGKTTNINGANNSESTTFSTTNIIIGVIGGIGLLLCCIVIIFLFYREKSRKEIKKEELRLEMEKLKTATQQSQHNVMTSTSIPIISTNDTDINDLKYYNVNLNNKNNQEGGVGIINSINNQIALPKQPRIEGKNMQTAGGDIDNDSDSFGSIAIIKTKNGEEESIDEMYTNDNVDTKGNY